MAYIVDVIEDIVENELNVGTDLAPLYPVFAYGEVDFHNTLTELDFDNSVVYLELPDSDDNSESSGYLTEVYNIRLYFAKLGRSDIDMSPDEYRVIHKECRRIRRIFIAKIRQREDFANMDNINTAEANIVFDVVTYGVVVTMQITPVNSDEDC